MNQIHFSKPRRLLISLIFPILFGISGCSLGEALLDGFFAGISGIVASAVAEALTFGM